MGDALRRDARKSGRLRPPVVIMRPSDGVSPRFFGGDQGGDASHGDQNATPDDLKAVAAVEAECFPQGEAATEEALRERLLVYPDHFWLLFDGDRLVGFVNGMVSDEPDLRDGMYADASII